MLVTVMKNSLSHLRALVLPLGIVALVLLSACQSPPARRSAGVLDYLYPEGKPAEPPADVHLALPLRVGLAFVPEDTGRYHEQLEANEEQQLLERIRDAFAETEEASAIEIIPSNYLTSGGGFENLRQLRGLLGIDLVMLVSYDQQQFDDMNAASLTYWTVIGAYVVPGNVNDTHTLVTASIFDIQSRALLFHATGDSQITGHATAMGSARSMRERSAEGMTLAVDELIGELQLALPTFREQVKSGTVRGAGTPAVTIASVAGGGSVGGGAFGPIEALAGLVLLVTSIVARKRR
jgi:rhombotail lipoprotein